MPESGLGAEGQPPARYTWTSMILIYLHFSVSNEIPKLFTEISKHKNNEVNFQQNCTKHLLWVFQMEHNLRKKRAFGRKVTKLTDTQIKKKKSFILWHF